jgi:hypothetical protein
LGKYFKSFCKYRSSVLGGQRFMTKSTLFSTCRHCLHFSFFTCDRCVIFCIYKTYILSKRSSNTNPTKNRIFASQGLRSAPLLSTLGRLSRNIESSWYCFLFFMTKSTLFSTCRHCLHFSFFTCDRCVIFC